MRPQPDSEPRPPQRDDATQTWHASEVVPGTVAAPTLPGAITKVTTPEPFAPQFPVEGEEVDDFHLLKELGRGAMGVVFLRGKFRSAGKLREDFPQHRRRGPHDGDA